MIKKNLFILVFSLLSHIALAKEIVFYSVPRDFYEDRKNLFEISFEAGEALRVGHLILSNETFYFSSDGASPISSDISAGKIFLFNKTSIAQFQNLEIRLGNGMTLSRDIKNKKQDPIDINILDSLKKLNVHKRTRSERVEVCLSNRSSEEYLRICLPKYYARIENDMVFLKKIKMNYENFAIFNSKPAANNTASFKSNQLFNLDIQNSNGFSLDTRTKFNAKDILDIVKNEANDLTVLSRQPLAEESSEVAYSLYSKNENSIFDAIGFSNSIGHFKPLYKYKNISDRSTIKLINNLGLSANLDLSPFNFSKQVDKPRTDQDNFQISSYQKEKQMPLITSENIVFEESSSIQTQNSTPVWAIKRDRLNIYNENVLPYKFGEQRFIASHLAYRTHPGQASARISNTVTADSDQLLSSEVHLQYWFENIFGWQNYYLSEQRWGIDTQYFKSLNKFSISDIKSNYESTSVNLRYRLSPGVWNYDETLGVLIGYQSFTLLNTRFPMAGFGVFWSRSMPKFFDDLLNYIPLLRKKKWVNVDLTYFNTPLDKDKVAKKLNYKLNFYGKVLWTDRFFTEIGFGMRTHDLEIKSDETELQFQTYYGAVGLGLDF